MKRHNNKTLALAVKHCQPQKTGVREWADSKYNIGIGCSHNCIYCYARGYAVGFRGLKRDTWAEERLKTTMPRVCKFNGLVMVPSSHDITPYYLAAVEKQLKALLEKGNQILVVSKPHRDCIVRLCGTLARYKEQILFRFTIGSLSRKLTCLWEPGAPSPAERVACLKYAYHRGFETSVSMEPLLAGVEDAVITFGKLIPFVTETVWLGKMNHVNRWGHATPEITTACHYIRQLQSDAAIFQLVQRLGSHPKVRWKDSIQAVICSHERSDAAQIN